MDAEMLFSARLAVHRWEQDRESPPMQEPHAAVQSGPACEALHVSPQKAPADTRNPDRSNPNDTVLSAEGTSADFAPPLIVPPRT